MSRKDIEFPHTQNSHLPRIPTHSEFPPTQNCHTPIFLLHPTSACFPIVGMGVEGAGWRCSLDWPQTSDPPASASRGLKIASTTLFIQAAFHLGIASFAAQKLRFLFYCFPSSHLFLCLCVYVFMGVHVL